MSNKVGVKVIKAKKINKATNKTQIANDTSLSEWIKPEYNQFGLSEMVSTSSILPQCIRAYKQNIAGFGIGVKYKNEEQEESSAMKAEFDNLSDIIETITMEKDTKSLFEELIEKRETYGIAYLEVIRNVADEVVEVSLVDDVETIKKTNPLTPYISIEIFYKGKTIERKKQFCKYKQEKNHKVVYFKEFGDPRTMDKRTGKYLKDGEVLELEYHANEILEFKLSTKNYGEPRWIGQSTGIYGARSAENLNNNYFENGRHTPLIVSVSGGTLSDESYDKLQQYMDNIKGEAGQHSFILLEVDGNAEAGFEEDKMPKIEIKSIADVLQKDELFQDYLNNNRKKVQSSFLLPDIYVGYTTEFNRATAEVAQEVTENQVFQPERKSLEWIINNKLLSGYKFEHVEIFFRAPDISNVDSLINLLNAANSSAGITPNKAKDIVYTALGETAEEYDGDWANIPLEIQKLNKQTPNLEALIKGMGKEINKAETINESEEVVAVLKQVKRLLIDMKEAI